MVFYKRNKQFETKQLIKLSHYIFFEYNFFLVKLKYINVFASKLPKKLFLNKILNLSVEFLAEMFCFSNAF